MATAAEEEAWKVSMTSTTSLPASAALWLVAVVPLLWGLAHGLPAAHGVDDAGVTTVSYGAVIKLEHVTSEHRLHSPGLAYGSGSGQQSVTGLSDAGDVNSYWVVKQAHGASRRPAGSMVQCGDMIRLQHLSTGNNLHSHLHKAPMSADYEVSAYRKDEASTARWHDGDSGDNWELQCDDDGPWARFSKVSLRHVDTGAFLSSSAKLKYSNPIPNQLQVAATKRKTRGSYWKTNEGFYLLSPTKTAPETGVGGKK
jgi:dolichyl-phosphate-mannose--protein O-mannosyl transferase